MKEFLLKLLIEIFGKLPDWAKPQSEDGKSAGELEKQLQTKIKKDGWK